MLDLFRKRGLSSAIYGTIIVATITVFVIQFRPDAGQRTAPLKVTCAATVKGFCIDPRTYHAAYRLLIPRDSEGNLMMARAKSMGLPKIAIDGLIERELLVSEAERIGLKVTEDELNDSIYSGYILVSIPSENPSLAYQMRIGDGRLYAGFRDPKTKQFEIKIYERSVRAIVGLSPTDFRDEQFRELLAAKMRESIRLPVRVGESEGLDTYLLEKSQATIEYVTVSKEFAARYLVTALAPELAEWQKVAENQAKIDALFKARKEDDLPKLGHYRQIFVKSNASSPNSNDMARRALAQLNWAAQRIRAGELFASVARDLSEDVRSVSKGGDLGDKVDGFPAPVKQAVIELRAGEMVPGIVKSSLGYHLVMKDDPSKSGEVEASLKRAMPSAAYVMAKSGDAAKAFAERIGSLVKGGKSAADAVGDALGALDAKKVVVSPLKVIAGAEGDASPLTDLELSTAPMIVSARNDIDAPKEQSSAPFSQGNAPIDDLTGESQKMLQTFAFSAAAGALMPAPLAAVDGFVVVRLIDAKKATREEFAKERDPYLETLLAAKRAETLALEVIRLRETAKDEIKVDESVLEEPGKKAVEPSQDDGQEE